MILVPIRLLNYIDSFLSAFTGFAEVDIQFNGRIQTSSRVFFSSEVFFREL